LNWLTRLTRPGPLDVYFRKLDDRALAHAEQVFFGGLRLSNGTYKTTLSHRLDDVNELAAEVLPRGRRLRVMDVGASSGITTAEWSEQLARMGVDHELVAGDLVVSGDLLTLGRSAAALWQEDGHPLAVQLGRRCIYLGRRIPGMSAARSALAAIHRLLVMHLPRSTDGAPPVAWALRRRRVALVSRRLAARPAVRLVVDDIAQSGRFAGEFDVCRAANVLNRSCFSDRELRAMAYNLRDRLAPGGVLIVCRTERAADGDVNRATVLRKVEGSLEVVARLNGGSDVEDLLLLQEERRDPPALTSVVLPVRNGEAHLAEQLAALADQTYAGPWELVVVDGSTDRSREIVYRFSDALPRLVLVDARRRPGLGRARNAGAAAARGELLANCDADDVVAPDWLEALVAAAAHADVVGGACRYDINTEAQRAWEECERPPPLRGAYDFLPYPSGGNCAVWAEVARELRWDESFAFGASDIEFGWRAQLAGFRLAFEPRAVIQRRFRTSPAAVGRRHFRGATAEPLLYRRFRARGMPRSNLLRAILAWCWLAATAGRLVSGVEERGKWLRAAGTRSGRVCGSVRHRSLYL